MLTGKLHEVKKFFTNNNLNTADTGRGWREEARIQRATWARLAGGRKS